MKTVGLFIRMYFHKCGILKMRLITAKGLYSYKYMRTVVSRACKRLFFCVVHATIVFFCDQHWQRVLFHTRINDNQCVVLYGRVRLWSNPVNDYAHSYSSQAVCFHCFHLHVPEWRRTTSSARQFRTRDVSRIIPFSDSLAGWLGGWVGGWVVCVCVYTIYD